MLAAFRRGLNETGHTEGKNVAIEFRWGGGQYDRLPALVEDLVRRQVAIIVTSGGEPAALTIPIVFKTSAKTPSGLASLPVSIGPGEI